MTNVQRPLWANQTALLLDLAMIDLESRRPVQATLVAFCDDRPLFLATLRPFDAGSQYDAIVEVGSVAAGMGANRVGVSLTGRAWSTIDPIVPASNDVDLRQRVVIVHRVDASIDPPSVVTTMLPYDRTDEVTTGEPVTIEGGKGTLTQVLSVTASLNRSANADELGTQIVQCERLGHRFAWSDTAVNRVEQAVSTAMCGAVNTPQ